MLQATHDTGPMLSGSPIRSRRFTPYVASHIVFTGPYVASHIVFTGPYVASHIVFTGPYVASHIVFTGP